MTPVVFSHFPSGISVKTIIHFSQMFSRHSLVYFDYGPRWNLLKYQSVVPNEYPLENINVPVHLIAGNNDFLSDTRVSLALMFWIMS